MKFRVWQSSWFILLLAFFTTLSLRIDMTVQPFFASFYYPDMLSFFLFISIFIFAVKTWGIKDKKVVKYALLIALLFSLLTTLGYSLVEDSSLYSMYASSGQVVKYIINFFGMAFLFYLVLVHVLYYILNYDHSIKHNNDFFPRKRIIIYTTLLIFLCYLPYFLIYYPGVITPDGTSQIKQTLGMEPLSNHHPLIHTLFIKIFIKLGLFVNNIRIGVAVYSLIQMIIVSSAFSLTLYKIRKWTLPPIFYWLSLIYFAVYPLHAMFSIFITKDIIFGIGILLFTFVIIDLINDHNYFAKKGNWLIFAGAALVAILVRNNGMYVVFPSLFLFILILKKQRKQLIIITIGLLTLFIFYKTVIFSVLNVSEGSTREMLSIPLQQVARVAKVHGDDLTKEQREFIENIFLIDITEVGNSYVPWYSDPIKAELDEDFYNSNKALFYTNWLKMFKDYPLTYIESFFAGSYGYWSLGSGYTHFYYLTEDDVSQEVGIHSNSKMPALYPLAENLLQLRFLPVFSLLFNIGLTFFLLLLYIFICIMKKSSINILVAVPLFLLFLTCVASPLYGEFRYAYGLFTTLPLIVTYALKIKNNDLNYVK